MINQPCSAHLVGRTETVSIISATAGSRAASSIVDQRAWPFADRSKQYIGPHLHKAGGITLDIDTDWVQGPVTR